MTAPDDAVQRLVKLIYQVGNIDTWSEMCAPFSWEDASRQIANALVEDGVKFPDPPPDPTLPVVSQRAIDAYLSAVQPEPTFRFSAPYREADRQIVAPGLKASFPIQLEDTLKAVDAPYSGGHFVMFDEGMSSKISIRLSTVYRVLTGQPWPG